MKKLSTGKFPLGGAGKGPAAQPQKPQKGATAAAPARRHDAARRLGPFFLLGEFMRASRGDLTDAEVESAEWWARDGLVLDTTRERFGPVRISSYVRPLEISGPRAGQEETGPHGRKSTIAGNGIDIVPTARGVKMRDVVRFIWERFGGREVFAVLDGGDHVHITRREHPGSTPGPGVEGRQRPNGSTPVTPLDFGPGAGAGGSSPGGGKLTPRPGSTSGPKTDLGGSKRQEEGDDGVPPIVTFVAVAGLAWGAWYVMKNGRSG